MWATVKIYGHVLKLLRSIPLISSHGFHKFLLIIWRGWMYYLLLETTILLYMSHFLSPCRNGTWKISCKEWSLNVIKRNKNNCFTEEHLLTGRDGIIGTGYPFTCSSTNDSANVINITWYKVPLKCFLVYRRNSL